LQPVINAINKTDRPPVRHPSPFSCASRSKVQSASISLRALRNYDRQRPRHNPKTHWQRPDHLSIDLYPRIAGALGDDAFSLDELAMSWVPLSKHCANKRSYIREPSGAFWHDENLENRFL